MPIKLLIVDDSALMRRQLAQLFQAEGDFEIALAHNGREAVAENLRFQPDVITLDINMPEMDGLTALAEIMAARPVAVVMVSSLTEKGALATLEALALGAVDYVAKPGGTISLSIERARAELLTKVRAAARARVRHAHKGGMAHGLSARLREEREARAAAKAARPSIIRRGLAPQQGLVLIGVSTGGPSTLEGILPMLPGDYPFPVIVAQHMPPAFTGPFAARIDQLCELNVVEVSRPMELEAGTVYIAKGGTDAVVAARAGKLVVLPKPESPQHLWHPSAEVLGRSVLDCCDAQHVIGVMLTGMGYDGADAFAEIMRRGGRTIAESEESSVVFGMPRELIERKGATKVLAAQDVAGQLIKWAVC